MLALGVCYLARLEEATRQTYAEFVSAKLEDLIGARNALTGTEYLFEQIELYVMIMILL